MSEKDKIVLRSESTDFTGAGKAVGFVFDDCFAITPVRNVGKHIVKQSAYPKTKGACMKYLITEGVCTEVCSYWQ